jgi:hypothetical protein
MKRGTTFKGKAFLFEGDLTSFLTIYPVDKRGSPTGTKVEIDGATIELVKKAIGDKGRIQMGACRDNPAKQSLGEMLYNRKKSPQWLSYILPLLEKDNFITHYKEGNAFWVKKKL